MQAGHNLSESRDVRTVAVSSGRAIGVANSPKGKREHGLHLCTASVGPLIGKSLREKPQYGDALARFGFGRINEFASNRR